MKRWCKIISTFKQLQYSLIYCVIQWCQHCCWEGNGLSLMWAFSVRKSFCPRSRTDFFSNWKSTKALKNSNQFNWRIWFNSFQRDFASFISIASSGWKWPQVSSPTFSSKQGQLFSHTRCLRSLSSQILEKPTNEERLHSLSGQPVELDCLQREK